MVTRIRSRRPSWERPRKGPRRSPGGRDTEPGLIEVVLRNPRPGLVVPEPGPEAPRLLHRELDESLRLLAAWRTAEGGTRGLVGFPSICGVPYCPCLDIPVLAVEVDCDPRSLGPRQMPEGWEAGLKGGPYARVTVDFSTGPTRLLDAEGDADLVQRLVLALDPPMRRRLVAVWFSLHPEAVTSTRGSAADRAGLS